MEATPRSLIEHFSHIKDHRIDRSKRHILIDILVIDVIGVLCGAKSWEDIEMIASEKEDWLKKFLELPHGIPSHDTISRFFHKLSAATFESCFLSWMKDVAELTDGEVVAIDGKRLRRSFDKSSGKAAIQW